jgi:hypothetical protein
MQPEQKMSKDYVAVELKVWLVELVVLMLDLTGSCELRGAQFCIGIAPPSHARHLETEASVYDYSPRTPP